ncbi:hypothetical protein M8J77_003817 [Diaphorina citri]|nr:hypothetical protein M8J77_003817 [Diaphorina citri]
MVIWYNHGSVDSMVSTLVFLFLLWTYFLLYDFIDYFEKDGPSTLPREKFLILVNQIFKVKPESEQAAAIIHEYTDWENVMDEHLNQKLISDAVGDYFFICPTNHFAQTYASRGGKVYYYFFTQNKPYLFRIKFSRGLNPRPNASKTDALPTTSKNQQCAE